MKKILVIAVLSVCLFVGCGGNSNQTPNTNSGTNTEQNAEQGNTDNQNQEDAGKVENDKDEVAGKKVNLMDSMMQPVYELTYSEKLDSCVTQYAVAFDDAGTENLEANSRIAINFVNLYSSFEEAIQTITKRQMSEDLYEYAENISEITTIQVGKYEVSRCQFDMSGITQTCFGITMDNGNFILGSSRLTIEELDKYLPLLLLNIEPIQE